MKSESLESTAVRLLSLFCFASALSFAGTWSGTLVDAGCYSSVEWNHNANESTGVRDLNMAAQVCAPKAKTHSFAILDQDGEAVKLDSTGNAKAAELVKQVGKRSPFFVTINGEMNKAAIDVKSIVPAK